MEGPWGTMDPDKVDGETGNFWRALYKLEKQFGDVPNAQKIAARVNLICCSSVTCYKQGPCIAIVPHIIS